MEVRVAAARTGSPEISMTRCCQLLGVHRSRLYYEPVEISQSEIDLMNLIRDIWLKRSFYGYRKITCELQRIYGYVINRKRVKRLMDVMGIKAIYPTPKTSIKSAENPVYPYLLEKLKIDRPNQVWMVDITYLKLGRRFVYLVALIDVFSRYMVGWSLGETLSTDNCLKALKSALRKVKPEIINSDQGCQFTSGDWIKQLTKVSIKISMNGKGRCIDNIYIERFWRTIKYEAIFLNEYHDVNELKKAIKKYIHFYNFERYHQRLNYQTPSDIYFGFCSNL
jgi:putative transposase